MNAPDWLYQGWVHHARHGEVRHRFRYPALFICLPLGRLQALRTRLFGINRRNLLAWHASDHGDGRADAEAWARGLLAAQGLTALTGGEIWLQTQPRVFGFVFNPVSFWYCHDHHQQLRAVLCEVNNTFGERHVYLLTAPGQAVIDDRSELSCRKVFHVSPFLPVAGHYRFRFARHGNRRTVRIDYHDDHGLRLSTAISGVAGPLDDRHLLAALARHGWSTLAVVWRIHVQALRLWRHGAPFYRKPAPPLQEISQ